MAMNDHVRSTLEPHAYAAAAIEVFREWELGRSITFPEHKTQDAL